MSTNERLITAKPAPLSADHAFDPIARQGQEEWEDYLAGRSYDDEKGNLHDAKSGRFITDPNAESADEHYDRLQHESETDGRFSHSSLKELAETVREARTSGDRTLENDARAAFDEKFTTTAEKYGWEGVVEHEDGTVDNRDEIAAKRRAHFESIMDGTTPQESDTVENSMEPAVADIDPEFAAKQQEIVDDYEAKKAELLSPFKKTEEVAEESSDDGTRWEEIKKQQDDKFDQEKTELIDSVMAGYENSSELPFTEGDAEELAKKLKSEPGHRAEGEAKYLRDTPESGTDGQVRRWFDRARDAANGRLTKFYYGIGRTMNKLGSNERKEGESDDEYNERMKRNGRGIAIGITAVAIAFGAYKLYNGIDHGSGNGGGMNAHDHLPQVTPEPNTVGPDTANSIGAPSAPTELLSSDAAWDIPSGSGGEALMDRLGVDKTIWYQHQDEFLNNFPSEAYRMSDGNVGFDTPGRLSDQAIKFWSQYAK